MNVQTFHFPRVDSTNEAARRLLREKAIREPFYVLADEQTAGKGTRGRTWVSPRNAGIYLTVVDFPPVRTAPSEIFTLAAGVACAEALNEATGIDVRLKPVNDLYIGQKKLGGILTEAIVEAGCVDVLITGVGINVRRAERPVGQDSAEPVSLEDALAPEAFARLDLDCLTALLVSRLLAWNRVVYSGNTERVRDAFARRQLPTSGGSE